MPYDVGMDPFARVELPEDIQRRLTVYKAAGGLCLIAAWGWFALEGNDRPRYS
ncbi:MAG: hypothetical protein M3138_07230 [Actinomycetota bacterium]|nr:hypothetical protein [Actinomycetota bacterium]